MKAPALLQKLRRVPRSLLVELGVALTLLVALGVVSRRNSLQQARAADWVAHTYEVAAKLQSVFSIVQDADSAERAFFLTGIETYLQPYERVIDRLPGEIKGVRAVIRDNPVQSRRLDKLSKDIEERLKVVREHIAQRREKGAAVISGNAMTGMEVPLMETVRDDVQLMIGEEDRLLKERLDLLAHTRRLSVWLQLAAGGLSFLLLTLAFINLARQIARANRAEEEIQRSNQQLKDANNELRAFSYSVAHDLRSPLRAINGFAQVVVEDHGDKLDEEGRRALSRITANAKMMAQLIDDLLELSKISYQPLRADKVEMNELVRSAYDELMETQKGRVVEVEIGSLPPAAGDPSLLRQVWLNLIDNALKFTRNRERTRIEIGGNVAGPEFATYFIRDNGAGFDMEHSDKLFGAFQRLHRPGDFEGTGIGLALVQRIIQRHGGAIWAEGQEEKGARFAFTLPEWSGA